jgi:hypothetical protein
MNQFKLFTLRGVVLLLFFLALPSAEIVRAQGCGLQPLKPLIPLGCKDLVPQCSCDANGKNCHWEWTCVK